MKKILVIDDDRYMCDLIVNSLEQMGFRAEGTYFGKSGMKMIADKPYDMVLCDYRLPETNGLEVLRFTRKKSPATRVVIITAYADIRIAVSLMKEGAFDYVTKPLQMEEVRALIKKAQTPPVLHTPEDFMEEFIVGDSPEIKEVMQHVDAVGPTDISVLIEGETGSGKEYVARAIHYASNRRDMPFIAVDCGALPTELANSELFGHVKGAFTGAIKDKTGYFEEAKGGTIFLDEVGNLPHENQVKLLRALQERVITRVGDFTRIPIDVRVIAASNEELIGAVKENRFREDLYHRLNGFAIKLPALRERGDDIFIFANHFREKANHSFGKSVKEIEPALKKLFKEYSWPGNIRELQNVVNRCVLLSQGDTLEVGTVPEEMLQEQHHADSSGSDRGGESRADGQLREATLEAEKEAIIKALARARYNKSKAAKILDIDRKTLYNKIREYNIDLSGNG